LRTSSSYGRLFVIAGPSGAGKTTLARHLVETFDDAVFSVSTTTRSPRGDEVQGRDYDFVSNEEFEARRRAGYFLEWAEVHGSRYGTSGDWVRRMTGAGSSVVLDIDVQGAMQVRRRWPGSVLVFVLPPSPGELRRRLSGRGTDSADTVRRRMEAAAEEVRWLGAFDHFIRNDGLDGALAGVENVYRATATGLRWAPYPAEALSYHGLSGGLDYWRGRRAVVTAGPTREPIDGVRFLSNRSSGLMGCMLASALRDAGADVDLIAGPLQAPPPSGVRLKRVVTASEMGSALAGLAPGCSLLAMAAAVSDFRPAKSFGGKMDRRDGARSLDLEPNPDLLAGLEADCPVLAFALEYGGEAEERALSKLRRKGAFAVFLNRGDREGVGMESAGNAGVLLREGRRFEVPQGSKRFVAEVVADRMGTWLAEAAYG
jgi:guanylate kinase